MTAPATKAELMTTIADRWSVLQSLVAALSNEELERPLGDGWSAKVHLAHITAWERSLMGLLRKQDRGEAAGLPHDLWAGHDTDQMNAYIAERAAPRPLADVLSESREVHDEVIGLLESLSQADLDQPYSSYQPQDPRYNAEPVVGWVHGNTYHHYDEHIGWLQAGLKLA